MSSARVISHLRKQDSSKDLDCNLPPEMKAYIFQQLPTTQEKIAAMKVSSTWFWLIYQTNKKEIDHFFSANLPYWITEVESIKTLCDAPPFLNYKEMFLFLLSYSGKIGGLTTFAFLSLGILAIKLNEINGQAVVGDPKALPSFAIMLGISLFLLTMMTTGIDSIIQLNNYKNYLPQFKTNHPEKFNAAKEASHLINMHYLLSSNHKKSILTQVKEKADSMVESYAQKITFL